jgi:hypothetical protein
MKKLFVMLTLIILVMSACAPRAQATQEPVVAQPQPTHINTDLTPAQRIAISTLAKNLGITPDKVKLVSTEAVDWPDSCLGVTTEGIMCSQVVTSGFRVVLEANGKQVEYHTNQDASVIVPATVVLTWNRNGGVAGFCDSMTIYLSGEVQATSCKKNDIVQKPLSELVSPAEVAVLNDWVTKYGTVNIDASDPAMTVNLKLIGTGTQQLTSKDAQNLLLQFVQDLNQKLMNK